MAIPLVPKLYVSLRMIDLTFEDTVMNGRFEFTFHTGRIG